MDKYGLIILILLSGCATQPLPYKVENFVMDVQMQAIDEGLKFNCVQSANLAENLINDYEGWAVVKPIEKCQNGEAHQYVVAKKENKTYQILRCQ